MIHPRFIVLILLGAFSQGCTQNSGSSGDAKTAPDSTAAQRHNDPTATSKPPYAGVVSEAARDRSAFADKNAKVDPKNDFDVQAYVLQARFDWDKKILTATEKITLKKALVSETLQLDAQVYKILDVTTNGQKLPWEYRAPEGHLNIDVSSLLEENIVVELHYEAYSNENSEGLPSALRAIPARVGDPVKTHVFYTLSEPLGAATWLPCHNVPSDRAQFKIEFEVPATENFVANGKRMSDTVHDGKRKIIYESLAPLPTYLMAFAGGELIEYAATKRKSLPVSVWARKGLKINSAKINQATIEQIDLYTELMGRYPFPSYAVVLLPDHPAGGVENAGISFNREEASSDAGISDDYELMAHELAHQWFGDKVTVTNWNDLWIKEGMATLLAAEAIKMHEGGTEEGPQMGDSFEFKAGDKVVDRSLEADDKYTSGPYGRAAWLLTQVRDELGEANFWYVVRKILKEKAYSSISTEEFIQYFDHYAPGALGTKLAPFLDHHDRPRLQLKLESGKLYARINKINFFMRPLTLRRLELGTHTDLELNSDFQEIPIKENSFWVVDPKDLHPDVDQLADPDDAPTQALLKGEFARLQIPPPALFAEFGWLSSNQQARALAEPTLWKLESNQYLGFYEALGQGEKRSLFAALNLGCTLAQTDAEFAANQVIDTALETTVPLWAAGKYSGHLGACEKFANEASMGNTVYQLMSGFLHFDQVEEKTFNFLALLGLPFETEIKFFPKLMEKAYNYRLRALALARLEKIYFARKDQGIDVDHRVLPLMLAEYQSTEVPHSIVKLAQFFVQTGHPDLLAPIGNKMFPPEITSHDAAPNPLSPNTLAHVFCASYQLAQNEHLLQSDAWSTLSSRIRKVGHPSLQRYLDKPELCQSLE